MKILRIFGLKNINQYKNVHWYNISKIHAKENAAIACVGVIIIAAVLIII